MTLRGPWEYEWVERHADVEQGESTPDKSVGRQRVKMPSEWQTEFGGEGGTVRFRRHFNKPTNLDANESVFVVLTGFGGAGIATLNDQPLGTIASSDEKSRAEFEITRYLKPGNQLALEIEFDPGSSGDRRGGLWGPVVLEIRSTD